MNDYQLESERIKLKPITPQYIHDTFNNHSENEIKELFNVDQDSYDHLKEMHEQGIESYRISLFYFLLIDKTTNEVIGESGFHTWNKVHQRAELFYSLRSDQFKKKGIMSEVLPLVINYGFNQMNLHRMEALVADWNTPSVRLLEKNNFTKEGTMREDYYYNGKNEDSDCYSLLKWEWNTQN